MKPSNLRYYSFPIWHANENRTVFILRYVYRNNIY